MNIITLLTDFGLKDEYVGLVKGVILSINPEARIIDISHDIDPQDVLQAAYMIKASYPYFPKGTVHVVVVDPGVGGKRSIVAVNINGHTFIAPDNGVLSLLLEEGNIESAVAVENRAYFLSSVSSTFHGRDIFSPVAAHVSRGLPVQRLGRIIKPADLVRRGIKKPGIKNGNIITGVVIAVDRFGNLLTNIDKDLLPLKKRAVITFQLNGRKFSGLSDTYESVKKEKPLAIIGSRGYLEISVNCGNAAVFFDAAKGDTIEVVI